MLQTMVQEMLETEVMRLLGAAARVPTPEGCAWPYGHFRI
jgi:hypothetical protein